MNRLVMYEIFLIFFLIVIVLSLTSRRIESLAITASIVLGLIFIGQKYATPRKPIIEAVITATVLLSIFIHGITSAPGAKYYSRFVKKLPPDAPELEETVERPVRTL